MEEAKNEEIVLEVNSWFQVENCSSPEDIEVANTIRKLLLEIALFNYVRVMINDGFVYFCAAIGIVGNLISIVILTRRQMKSSMNYLLTGLAVSDILAILCTVVIMLPMEYFFYFTSGWTYTCTYIADHFDNFFFVNVYTEFSVRPIKDMAYTITAYLTLALTIERYIAVGYPLQARVWCTQQRARMSVLSIIIISILINANSYWIYQVAMFHVARWNVSLLALTYPKSSKYIIWFQSTSTAFLPMAIILVLNIAIFLQIRKANRRRQHLTHSQRNELHSAIMMMCIVSVIFLRLVFLVTIYMFEVQGLRFENEQYWRTEEDLIFTNELLVTFNSSINFVLYIIFGSQFKETSVEIFCHRLPCLQSFVPVTVGTRTR